MINIKIILYHSDPLKFGGIDTFDYNFCKKMKKYHEIIFMYRNGNKDSIKRIKDLGIGVVKYQDDKKYICDICICASAWGGYPDNVIANTGRYIQMIHADYIMAKEGGFFYKKWFKTTEHVGVGQHVCDVFNSLYPNEKITRIYNILDSKRETTHILKLISATRLSPEKGYNRMLKLAQALRKANVKFRWTVFTDLDLYNQKPFDMEEFVYMSPSHDFIDYIVEADYGVQLSDTEGYCYFINECLQYGTPVLSTNYPSASESVVDGENGYLLKMDLSNLDIDKIINHIPNDFDYREKGKIEDWTKLFNKKYKKPKLKYKVTALIDYTDKRPELMTGDLKVNENYEAEVKKGDIYYLFDGNRAKEIKASGFAKVQKI